MNKASSRFTEAYLDKKRQELTRLRDTLRAAADAAQAEGAEVKQESNSQAREYEDEAQRLDMLEISGELVVRDVRRLSRVERALAKITEGTYGISDVSEQQIPLERLEAIPDAINTRIEQASAETDPGVLPR
jgi:DnaK suppressor protein